MRRREFIRGLLAAGLLGVSYRVVRAVEGDFPWRSSQRLLSRSLTAMGTFVSVTVVAESNDQAEEAIGYCFEKMDSLVKLLSRHDQTSPVYLLNTKGHLDSPPPSLFQLLRLAKTYSGLTEGAFDVTVLPVLSLYERDFSQGREPSEGEIKELLDLVGVEKLHLDPSGIYFSRPGMAITLDGLAKGYIVDAMVSELKARGVRHGLVNAGGDIRAFGGREEGRPWRIAIRDPKAKDRILADFGLADGACATSGDYEIYFDQERFFYHIVDPRSGYSPRFLSSATVLADSAVAADAFSTALMVLGPAGIDLLKSLRLRAYLLDREGRSYRV
ncbi:FAD:protein FMN transferase [Thermosulfuriphilus sp.]